jgi:periplasmic divalent cation tolerance protein
MTADLTQQIAYLITSVASEEEAQSLARAMINQHLAACVQTSSRMSYYPWQGKLEEQQEYILHIKTSRSSSHRTMQWLKERHPYSLPEILLLTVEASEPYAQWVDEQCDPHG